MDTLENAQKRAEYWKAESMAATREIESLRAQVAELADAFTVIWVSDDRSAWDGKAVEHFDALMAKVGAGRTAIVTRKMITAAHGVTLESGDVVLSARLIERIFLAMDAAR